MDRTFNPCDECDYSFTKQNQESGMCKICEFKQLLESKIDAIELCKIHIALDKLKEYQRLEEQGLLLKLPCKVGDTVYAYCSEFGILEYEVDEIIIDKKITFLCSAYSEPIGDCPSECLDEIEPDITDFSKTVFLTKEEAEQALQRMKEGD